MKTLLLFAAFLALFPQTASPRKTVKLPGGVNLEFAWITPGSFVMGSPGDEANRDAVEGTQHPVMISRGFYLGLYEVTQRQWLAVMGVNPSVLQQAVAGENTLDRPVDSVSWQETQLFIERLNSLGLGRFRLPTEAEWEYAARAGTTTPYSLSGDVHQFVWANSRSFARTHPVGQKPANAWGLFDMHGNVWEWCSDWYAPYTAEPVTDPTGPASGKERVFRGGSWYDFPAALRSANRHRHAPDVGYTAIGLRLVLEASVQEERTATLPGGIGMCFTHIPAGEFLMGSPATEIGRANDESPVHSVMISQAFWLGTYSDFQMRAT
jgi:formylglycine-generating enzyme required for sulfatase activity